MSRYRTREEKRFISDIWLFPQGGPENSGYQAAVLEIISILGYIKELYKWGLDGGHIVTLS